MARKSIPTIPFSEYQSGNGIRAIIDLSTCPVSVSVDYANRNEIISSGKVPCERCDGTGNEHMWTYRRTSGSGGTGQSVLAQADTTPDA